MLERFDLYAAIHKALRHYMGAVLLELGRLDLADPAEVARAGAMLRGLLDWLAEHLAIEERFIHTALAERHRDPLVATLRRDHDDHVRSFAMLRLDLEALERSSAEAPVARNARARQLYLTLTRFIADNFQHMAVEETELNPLLWQHFTDAELFGMYRAILASEAPEQLELGVTWLLPALPPAERAKTVGGVRMLLPPELFERLLGQAQRALGTREFEKLARDLAI